MRYLRLNLMMVSFCVIASCGKVDFYAEDNQTSFTYLQASCLPDTKTSYASDANTLSVRWKEGDQIGVSINGSEFVAFLQTGEISADGHTTTFVSSGVDIPNGANIVAIYPFSSEGQFDLSTQSGKLTDLGKYDIMKAEGTASDKGMPCMHFTPLVTVMRVPSGQKVTQASDLMSAGLSFSGPAVNNGIKILQDGTVLLTPGTISVPVSVSAGSTTDDVYFTFAPDCQTGDVYFLSTDQGDLFGFSRAEIETAQAYNLSNLNSNIVFADDEVKRICVANWDTDFDGELSYVEAAAVTDLKGAFFQNKKITQFNELRFFVGLESLEYKRTMSAGTNVEITVNGVFWHCEKLEKITLPYSLKVIGAGCFDGCTSLRSLTIPRYVTTIGNLWVDDCSSLSTITFLCARCTQQGSWGASVYKAYKNYVLETIYVASEFYAEYKEKHIYSSVLDDIIVELNS